MKKLIIFDLDGTIIDTLEDLKNAVNHALKLKNYPERSLEQIRLAIGNGVGKLVARSLPDNENNLDYEYVLSEFRKYYSVHSDDFTKPYDGVYEELINLKKECYLLAVATNKLNDIARELVEKFYPSMFDIIQGDQIGMERKPAPMMINTICQKLNINKKDAFYIGDTDVDMQTALNSEIDFVLVTYGYRTKEELKILCPHQPTIDSIKDLSKYLKNID